MLERMQVVGGALGAARTPSGSVAEFIFAGTENGRLRRYEKRYERWHSNNFQIYR